MADKDTRTAIDQFMLEAALLCSSLAAISMRNEKCRIAQEVENGFQSYADLLRRKNALPLTHEDESTFQEILRQIKDRLRYLKVWRVHSSDKRQPSR